MSNIKQQYEQAAADLSCKRSRLNDYMDEKSEFENAAVAATHLHNNLKRKKGKMSQKELQAPMEANANAEMTASAFYESDRMVKTAEQAVNAAKKKIAELQPRYNRWLAAEKKRAEEAKKYAKDDAARRKRYEEQRKRQEDAQQKDGGTKGTKGSGKRPREEEPKQPEPVKVSNVNRQLITRKEAQVWLDSFNAAFAKPRHELRDLPEVALRVCDNKSCVSERPDCALRMCRCDIKEVVAFQNAPVQKKLRLRLHPGLYERCPDDVCVEVQKKATVFFSALS